ncbi:MAG: hypothetical protein Q8O00_11020 [Holophaga sp.]|nr:hypothetical protein [Holophaga sp.]
MLYFGVLEILIYRQGTKQRCAPSPRKAGAVNTPKGRPCRIFGQKSAFLGSDFWPKMRSAAKAAEIPHRGIRRPVAWVFKGFLGVESWHFVFSVSRKSEDASE